MGFNSTQSKLLLLLNEAEAVDTDDETDVDTDVDTMDTVDSEDTVPRLDDVVVSSQLLLLRLDETEVDMLSDDVELSAQSQSQGETEVDMLVVDV